MRYLDMVWIMGSCFVNACDKLRGKGINAVAMATLPVFHHCPYTQQSSQAVGKELTLSPIHPRLKIPGNKLITETPNSFHHIHQPLFHLKDSQRTFQKQRLTSAGPRFDEDSSVSMEPTWP